MSLKPLFGETAFVSILEALVENHHREMTKKEIAEYADVSRSSVYQIWPRIESLGIIEEARKVGNVQLYCIDVENPVVEEIITLRNVVSECVQS